jgi:hypothetical protein
MANYNEISVKLSEPPHLGRRRWLKNHHITTQVYISALPGCPESALLSEVFLRIGDKI